MYVNRCLHPSGVRDYGHVFAPRGFTPGYDPARLRREEMVLTAQEGARSLISKHNWIRFRASCVDEESH